MDVRDVSHKMSSFDIRCHKMKQDDIQCHKITEYEIGFQHMHKDYIRWHKVS